MTLLAGLWGPSGLAASELQHLAESYRFSPGGDPPGAVTTILAEPPSRLALKFRPQGPDAPKVIPLSEGRHLITLGFSSAELDTPDEPSPEVLRRLQAAEGEFVAALFDSQRREVQLITDRFGVRPLYYVHLGDSFAWSTHIAFLLSLVGRGPQFDPLGVLQMTQLGHTLNGRTPYVDVGRVRPGTVWSLSPHGFSESQYWRLRYDVHDDLDFSEHAAVAFGGMLESTLSRCAGRRGFVSLSGGLDSRLVAACVPADRFVATTRHVPGVNDADVEVAREVAARLHLKHEIETIGSEDLLVGFERYLRLAGGVTPVHHGIGLMETIDGMIRSGGFKLGGGPGDVLAGSYIPSLAYLNPEWSAQMVDEFVRERPRFNRRELRSIFRKELVETYFPVVEDSLRSTMAQSDGPTAAHRVTAWAMVYRQPAFTFASPIAAHPEVSEASPHLGHAWTDAMLKLPASWLFRRNFYMSMIHAQLPALRDIKYANTGRLLPAEMSRYEIPTRGSKRARLRNLARGALKHELATAVMPVARARLPVKGRGTFATYDLMAKNPSLLGRLRDLVGTSPTSGIVDRDRALRYLTKVERGELFSIMNGDHASLLGALATLCLAPEALASQALRRATT